MIVLLLIACKTATCQTSSVITYKNGTITAPSEIPYGQIILLQGESEGEVESVEVECIVMTDTRTYKVDKESKTKWSAKIGPFPVRADLILTIKENRLLSANEKQSIKEVLNQLINELKTKGSFDSTELRKQRIL